MLETLSMFYYPVCLLQPIIINLKLIFQSIYRLKFHWNEQLIGNIKKDWGNESDFLCSIQVIETPSKVIYHNKLRKSMELHGFSDASFQGYGACIYVQTIHKSGEISVKLVPAKSRVTPLKETSIPKLELLGKLVLCKLMNIVFNALKNDDSIVDCFY